MAINFKKFDEGVEVATRKGQKARLALSGLAGSGKTETALVTAKTLTDDGEVLVIDTEEKSAGLYGDKFGDWSYKVYNWEDAYDPRDLTDAIDHFSKDYDAIIIDSLSHFWSGKGGLLEIVDRASRTKSGYTDNTKGWKEGTPIQEAMIQAILKAKCHVIVTLRAKAGIIIEQGENGKGKGSVRKVPLKIVQREDLIYEMTIAANIDQQDHGLLIEKSRCSDIEKVKHFPAGRGTYEFAGMLTEWLNGAEAEKSTEEMQAAIADTLNESVDLATFPDEPAPGDKISDTALEDLKDLFGNFQHFDAAAKQQEFVKAFGKPANLTVATLKPALDQIEEWLKEDKKWVDAGV